MPPSIVDMFRNPTTSQDPTVQGPPTQNPTQTVTDTGGGTTGSYTPGQETGLADLTGFAAANNYNPSLLQQSIYENPWYILQDVFKGINPASPGYQALRDIGADPLSLFNIMVNSQRSATEEQGPNDFTNFLAELYKNLGSAGGRTFDASELLGSIFGQKDIGADSKTALGSILGSGDMSTQVRTLFNLLRDVSNVSMNPLAARGYQSSIAQAGDRYGNAQLKNDAGATQSPTEWIKKNMPWLT